MKLSIRTVLFALIVSWSSFQCSGPLTMNVFPDSKDVNLGKEIDQQIRSNEKEYPILKNRPEVKDYIEGIGRTILSSPEIKKKNLYAYQFEVIQDDSTINAFCTPGGYIYVYTGLIKFLDNEATLAGVIGHEIAHAERRHATQRMTKAMGAQILAAVILGENPSQLAAIGANLFTGLGLLVNSRSDETESDTYSIRYLQSTPYYPGAIRYFFEKVLGGRTDNGSAFERLLSTHPLPQDRIENVKKIMQQLGDPGPTEANLFQNRYSEMKKKLP